MIRTRMKELRARFDLSQEDLARLVKRAELRVVEGAGHELNREAPEKLALLLREFYDRAPEVR